MLSELTKLPGSEKEMAEPVEKAGFAKIADLKGIDTYALYLQTSKHFDEGNDPCALYAVEMGYSDEELLKW